MGSKEKPRSYLDERRGILLAKMKMSTDKIMEELQSDPIAAKEAVVLLLRMAPFGPQWEGGGLLEPSLEERALRQYDSLLWQRGQSEEEQNDRLVLLRGLGLLLEHIQIEQSRKAKPPMKPNDEEVCSLCLARLETHTPPKVPGHSRQTVRYDVGAKRRKPRRNQILRAIAQFAFKCKAYTSVLSFAQLVDKEKGISAPRVQQIVKGIRPE